MEAIAYYYPEGHQAHAQAGHPERPERVERLRASLTEAGWWEGGEKISPARLSVEVLEGVHSREYLIQLQQASEQGANLDMDTYTTPASWELAMYAAGGAVAAATSVWQRNSRCAFALTRPPGHHAVRRRGMGFCLLNNIALAAENLIQNEGAKRLAIVDLDLHHGNGTQDVFWQRGDVFFLSVHQHPLYPGSGGAEETGVGDGLGATANCPLPPGSGDMAYEAVMDEFILPLLENFGPEMILVSFGFDPHWRDPLGHLQLSAQGYGGLIAALRRVADERCEGRIALFLEGGYDLDAGAACVQAAAAALLDEKFADPLGPSPREEGRSWKSALRQAKAVWGLP
ncbi:MAG: histone deacetylase [Chloroflexi bacterium]|nr:histone deacetylase [Chloroflexota bacterium]